jgi:hypothetical protein
VAVIQLEETTLKGAIPTVECRREGPQTPAEATLRERAAGTKMLAVRRLEVDQPQAARKTPVVHPLVA